MRRAETSSTTPASLPAPARRDSAATTGAAGRRLPYTRDTYWRTLQTFNATRVAIALVLLAYLSINSRKGFWVIATLMYVETCAIYLALSIAFMIVTAFYRRHFLFQMSAHLVADVSIITVLYVAAGGSKSGLAILYLFPLAGSAILAPIVLALFFVSLVTLIMLFESGWRLLESASESTISVAGLYGAAFFAAVYVINRLAARLIRQERLAEAHGQDLRIQQAINRLVIADMGDGVLVVGADSAILTANPAAERLFGLAGLASGEGQARFKLTDIPLLVPIAEAFFIWADGQSRSRQEVNNASWPGGAVASAAIAETETADGVDRLFAAGSGSQRDAGAAGAETAATNAGGNGNDHADNRSNANAASHDATLHADGFDSLQPPVFVTLKPGEESAAPGVPAGWAGRRDLVLHLKLRFASIVSAEMMAARTVIFLRDVGEIENQAQQLKLASMGRLTASIAHEVRNPLSAISYAAGLLGEEEGSATHARLVNIVHENVARLNRMIEDILKLSRKAQSQGEPVALATVCAEIVAEFQNTHAVQPGAIRMGRLDGEQVAFDPLHLREVIVNLLSNAVRYASGSDGSILLFGVKDLPGRLELHVKDDGAPITPQVRAHLFEPFYTTSSKGTGLGLYLARELCLNNNAMLDYEYRIDDFSSAMDEPSGRFVISFAVHV
ncbi:MAG: sensor histidine kinase [Janthinobacterium lividum]